MAEASATGVEKRTRHASRASLACTRCKRAKRRCDFSLAPGKDQSCISCKAKNQKCDIRVEDDKRRGKRRGASTDLDSRIAVLEEMIRRNGTNNDLNTPEPWPVSNVHHVSSGDSTSIEYRPSLSQFNEPAPQRPEFTGRNVDDLSPVNLPLDDVSMQNTTASPIGNIVSIETPGRSFAAAPQSPRPVFASHAIANGVLSTQKAASTISDVSSTIVDEVTAREGDLKGQDAKRLHFFGATSMFYHGARDATRQSSEEAVDDIRSRRLSVAEIETDVEPEPIVTHLMNLFFDWQASQLNVVDRETFLMHRRFYEDSEDFEDRTFYSPALLYAIISLASLISPDRGVRKYSSTSGGTPGDMFLRKAKALLDMEVGNPAVTTVQAALIVGSWYGAVGQTSLGWTYSGISFRLCYELGLHIDCSKVVKKGQIASEVAEHRKRVFWGCYTQDKLWSAYCGRPSVFMDWDISVGTPEWPSSITDRVSHYDISKQLREGNIYLAKRCSETLLSLYSQRHNSKPNELLEFATRIHKHLYRWHDQLPAELGWPRQVGAESPSPGTLLLHMQFYFTLILIHRPLIHMSAAQQAVANFNSGTTDSATVCTLAATNIAKLVRDYQQFYCLRRISSPAIHFTFIAATIHTVDFRLFKTERSKFLLQGCVSALTDMGESYPIGRKAVCILQDLIERWNPRNDTQRQEKNTLQSSGDGGLLGPGFRLNSRSGTVKSGKAVDVNRFQHGATGVSHAEPNDSVRTLEPFDWSEYNSPIELPPIFDASMICMPEADYQEMGTGPSAQLEDVIMCRAQSAFGQLSTATTMMDNAEFDFGMSLDEANLSAFYGNAEPYR
ncbi:hypothetical protein K505DRAFT_378882 [Melanomma pulvis-pyrius CBS 109.77]|uniref:Zn(2)-C6 fungal-type domain-containing protein n=1 Tax=Melanomma pulvis-pyrius CBS 109.77 TaxID=1314802 RepID=A0A6A6WX31_9PLEO|nr:hypothetical protein K505DRAFT_378882 [Melanomma pulvis-pyrius CBS 109.77]